jgi:hypothetical protein
MTFQLQAPFQPMGDQPEAIDALVRGVEQGMKHQVLLGATGTGKTFTMASVIQRLQMPALVMAHNKTLAAQLYAEFKEFFPHNAVEYFVSYYDYYQPEAYVPRHDLYIEKETEINEEIERLRLAATTALVRVRMSSSLLLFRASMGLARQMSSCAARSISKWGRFIAATRSCASSLMVSTSATTWNCAPALFACVAKPSS